MGRHIHCHSQIGETIIGKVQGHRGQEEEEVNSSPASKRVAFYSTD